MTDSSSVSAEDEFSFRAARTKRTRRYSSRLPAKRSPAVTSYFTRDGKNETKNEKEKQGESERNEENKKEKKKMMRILLY